jgi:guanylate kinase
MNHFALKHHQDFKTVLASYSMSERAKKALEGLRLVLLVAPTSTGRNTVIQELLRQKPEQYHFIISDTTRAPQVRDGKLEETGVNYFFNVMRAKPDTKAIFLLPPSFEEWQNRMASRGHMSEHELRNRLRSAATEFEAALHHSYYNYVTAENVSQSAAIIDAIAHDKPNPYQGRGVSLIHQLQDRLEQKLSSSPV